MDKEELYQYLKENFKVKRTRIWEIVKDKYLAEDLLFELYNEKRIKLTWEKDGYYVEVIHNDHA